MRHNDPDPTSRRIKILHFITDLKRGGEARLLLSLLPQYREQSLDGIICCFSRNVHQKEMEELDLSPEFEAQGFRVVSLDAGGVKTIEVIPKFFRLLREERPHILHTYLFHPNVLGRVIGRVAGVPAIVSSVVSVDDWKGSLHRYLEKVSSRFADAILVNAEAVRRQLVERDGVNPALISVFYNGVDVDRFKHGDGRIRDDLGWSQETLIIGSICRLHKAKGIQYLLRAFRIVVSQLSQVRLLIIGDGPLRKRLKAETYELGLGDKVVFLGARDNIPDILAALDIFVVSSVWEGIPGTIFEAMAAQVPIVSTAVGGISEALENERDALLVEPRNPEAIAAAVLRLACQREIAKGLVARAYEKVSRYYTFQKMVDQRIDFYKRLVAGSFHLGRPRHA